MFKFVSGLKCGLLSLILWFWFQNIAGFIITTLSFLKAKCNCINGTDINWVLHSETDETVKLKPRDWVIKNWTDILVSYANDFESAILDLYFPKTTQNFCSSAILHISITFIQF